MPDPIPSPKRKKGKNLSRKNRLDLVLINPGGRMQAYQSLGSAETAIEPPIWAGLIATFVRDRGLSVQILDANAEDLTPEDTADRIIAMNPVLAGVVVYGHNPSASTQIMPSAGAICAALKRKAPGLRILMAGGHVSALPERTLREENTDFVCGGEGPYTVWELLQALKSDQPELHKVHGLWYRDGENIRTTPPAPLVQDLDREMKKIAWDLLPMDRYRAHNWHCFGHPQKRRPYAALYTTLGCPYHCTFCCIQAPFKSGEQALDYRENVNSYRFWSPQSVIAQIDELVTEYGVRNLKIADEMFVLNSRHVLGICDLIIERGYDLNIWAYARVDTLKNGILEKMKRAGFNWLGFGIESGNERVRDNVSKNIRGQDIFPAVEKVRAAGMNVIGNYIFGLPEDDLASMQDTLNLALELNCDFANLYCAMAYPGSQLYQLSLREGWPLPDQWSGYSQLSADTLPLPTKHLSGAEVLRFRDRAFQIYFTNPKYLEMITGKFGPETTESIRQVTSHRLARKHA